MLLILLLKFCFLFLFVLPTVSFLFFVVFFLCVVASVVFSCLLPACDDSGVKQALTTTTTSAAKVYCVCVCVICVCMWGPNSIKTERMSDTSVNLLKCSARGSDRERGQSKKRKT